MRHLVLTAMLRASLPAFADDAQGSGRGSKGCERGAAAGENPATLEQGEVMAGRTATGLQHATIGNP